MRAIAIIATALIVCASLYGCVAFATWNFDPGHWSALTRNLLAGAWAFTLYVAVLLVNHELD